MTERTAGLDEALSPWLAAMAQADQDTEVMAGLTVGDFFTFHRAQPTPTGCRPLNGEVYRSVGGKDLIALGYARTDTEVAPLVLFIHGGAWAGGEPWVHARHCHAMAELGYAAVSVSYRLHPGITWPDPLEDVQAALDWVRANASDLGCDPSKVVVAGGSAGGHLSLMLAFTAPDPPAAVVAWYPAVDLDAFPANDDLDSIVDTIFGPAGGPVRRQASPISHVRGQLPPVLTLTGDADDLTELGPIQRMHDALTEAGVPNRLEVFPGRGHGFDLAGGDWDASVGAVSDFLSETLDDAGASA